MAKKKKQRKVDFTKEEIMDMSQRGSVQDLDYRLKKMKSYYGLDTSGFKTDSEGSGTESFFPAECGELLSLLCRNFDFNPAGRTKSAAKNVTATQVGDYYGRLCKEIDNLPLPFKSMVYGLPCHFASNGIGIWAERIVPILTKFIASYVEETQEDMGLLLKRLAIDIDRADYTLFVNQYYMRMAKEANKKGYMDNPDYREMLQLFDMEELKEDRVNIGVDREIASLISELLGDVKEKSKKMGFEEDGECSREEYYDTLTKSYFDYRFKMNEETLRRYSAGARGWKTYEERISAGECISIFKKSTSEEIVDLEQDIAYLEQHLKTKKELLEKLKKMSDEQKKARDDNAKEIIRLVNQAYLDKCDKVTRGEYAKVEDSVDSFVGRVLWEFLNAK